jgi:hypothetical protein
MARNRHSLRPRHHPIPNKIPRKLRSRHRPTHHQALTHRSQIPNCTIPANCAKNS